MEGHLIGLFPSYPLPLPPQAALPQCGLQRTLAFPWAPKRCQDVWNFQRNSLPAKSPERWWNGQALGRAVSARAHSFIPLLFLSGILKEAEPASKREPKYQWMSRQVGVQMAREVLTSSTGLGLCQDPGRSLTNCTLVKTAQIRGPHALRHEGQQNDAHQVRAPNTTWPKGITGFPSL